MSHARSCGCSCTPRRSRFRYCFCLLLRLRRGFVAASGRCFFGTFSFAFVALVPRPVVAFPSSSCGNLGLLGSLCACGCVVCAGSGLLRRPFFSFASSPASLLRLHVFCFGRFLRFVLAASSFSSTPGILVSSLISRSSLSSSCLCGCGAAFVASCSPSPCRAATSVARPWRRAGWGATFIVHRHSGVLDEFALGFKPVRLEFPDNSLAYTGAGVRCFWLGFNTGARGLKSETATREYNSVRIPVCCRALLVSQHLQGRGAVITTHRYRSPRLRPCRSLNRSWLIRLAICTAPG